MEQDSHKAWLRMGLTYLGIGGGLLTYLAYVIAIRSNAPPFTYSPLEELLMIPAAFFGGIVIFVLLGLGLYYIVKSGSAAHA